MARLVYLKVASGGFEAGDVVRIYEDSDPIPGYVRRDPHRFGVVVRPGRRIDHAPMMQGDAPDRSDPPLDGRDSDPGIRPRVRRVDLLTRTTVEKPPRLARSRP